MNSFIFEKMNRKYNSYDVVKDIAFITMIIDHIGYYLMPKLLVLRLVGRISAVLYAIIFGVSEHKNMNKLFTFAILTTLFQMFTFGMIFPLNIFFNFFLSALMIDYIEMVYEKFPYVFFCLFLTLLLPLGILTDQVTEYGVFLVFFMFCGRVFIKDKKSKKDLLATIIIFILYFAYSTNNFKFSIIQSVILFIFLIFIYINMFDFKVKEIENVKCETFLLVISRYSMELFLVQTVIFSYLLKLFLW